MPYMVSIWLPNALFVVWSQSDFLAQILSLDDSQVSTINWYVHYVSKKIDQMQLDWPSETDTLKINLPQDREGYDGFEYTDEKLSARRIHWCGEPSSILVFGSIFEEQLPK